MCVTTRMLLAGAAAAVLGLAGCGGDGGGDGARGCAWREARLCVEYPGLDGAALQDARESCADGGGVWELCPSTALAGTCQETSGGRPFLTVRYYAGNVCSAEEGRARCDAEADPELGLETTFTPGDATCGSAIVTTLVCDRRAEASSCLAATGAMAPERVAVFEGSCARDGALAASCPSGAVATCVSSDASAIEVTERYYAGADVEQARLDCEASRGAWAVD